MTKKIVIEMLAPWTVAVYLDGEILDCYNCLSEAAHAVVEACPGINPQDVVVTFCEDYQYKVVKALRRGINIFDLERKV